MADDIDVLAEAEVYASYGRYQQAREILQEALQREPGRKDIRERLAGLPAAKPRPVPGNRDPRWFFPGVFFGFVGYVVFDVAQHAEVRIAGIVLMAVGAITTIFVVRRFMVRDRR